MEFFNYDRLCLKKPRPNHFTREEVRQLARRHNMSLNREEIDALMELLDGHPYLTRRTFFELAIDAHLELETFLSQAKQDTGPFRDHLHHYWHLLSQKPELGEVLLRICRAQTYEQNEAFYRLEGAGLIKRAGHRILPRNRLYSAYLQERLNG